VTFAASITFNLEGKSGSQKNSGIYVKRFATLPLYLVKGKKREIENSGPKRTVTEGPERLHHRGQRPQPERVPAIRAASSAIGTASSAVLAIRSAGNCDVIVKKVLCALLSKTGKWIV